MIKNLYLNDSIVGYNNPAGVTRMTVDTKTGRTCIIIKDRYNNQRVIEISNETVEQRLLSLISANTEKIETISGQVIAIPEIQEQLSSVIEQLENQQTGLSAAHQHIDELSGIVTDQASGIIAINEHLNVIDTEVDDLSAVIDTKFIYMGSCNYDDLITTGNIHTKYVTYVTKCANEGISPILSEQEWKAENTPKEYQIYNITDRDNKAYLYYQGEWILFGTDTIPIATLNSNFETLSSAITVISGNTTNIFHFKGKVETKEDLPTEGNVEGDVYLVGQTKEFVYTLISGFIEIGDQGSHITRTEVYEIADYLSGQIDTKLTFKGLSSITNIIEQEQKSYHGTDGSTFIYDTKKGDFYIEEDTNRAWININGLSGIENWKAIGIDSYTKIEIDEKDLVLSTKIDIEIDRALRFEQQLSTKIDTEINRAENAENEVLSSANAYTDQKQQEAITSAKQYTDQQIEDLSDLVSAALSAQNYAALHYKGVTEWKSLQLYELHENVVIGDIVRLSGDTREYVYVAPSTWIELGIDYSDLQSILSSANQYTDQQINSITQYIDTQIISAIESSQLYTNEQIISAIESASNYTNSQIDELSGTVDIKISETTTDIIGQINSTSTYLSAQIFDLTTNINDQLSDINQKLIGTFHYKTVVDTYDHFTVLTAGFDLSAGDVYTVEDNENGEYFVEYVYTSDDKWVKLGSDNVASISASLSQEIVTNKENISELNEKVNDILIDYVPKSAYNELSEKYEILSTTLDNVIEILNSLSGIGVN